MARLRTVAEWMAERGLSLAQLTAAALLDERVAAAIVQGRYTASPQQRQRLATALGVLPEEIAWDYTVPVVHVYGHGPQFGRSP
jgi:lambda repressor-like predicted transcriptional regulator